MFRYVAKCYSLTILLSKHNQFILDNNHELKKILKIYQNTTTDQPNTVDQNIVHFVKKYSQLSNSISEMD